MLQRMKKEGPFQRKLHRLEEGWNSRFGIPSELVSKTANDVSLKAHSPGIVFPSITKETKRTRCKPILGQRVPRQPHLESNYPCDRSKCHRTILSTAVKPEQRLRRIDSVSSNMRVNCLHKNAVRACNYREKVLKQLQKAVSNWSGNSLHGSNTSRKNNIERYLNKASKELRSIGIECVEKIVEWILVFSECSATMTQKPALFMYNGQEYLVKMYSDLNFVVNMIGSEASKFGGFRINNPILLSNEKLKTGNIRNRSIAAHTVITDAHSRKCQNDTVVKNGDRSEINTERLKCVQNDNSATNNDMVNFGNIAIEVQLQYENNPAKADKSYNESYCELSRDRFDGSIVLKPKHVTGAIYKRASHNDEMIQREVVKSSNERYDENYALDDFEEEDANLHINQAQSQVHLLR